MAKYHAKFINHLDADRNTVDFPTDALRTNGALLEAFDFVEHEEVENADYMLEVWEYEVDEDDADRFENGLNETSTVQSWKRTE